MQGMAMADQEGGVSSCLNQHDVLDTMMGGLSAEAIGADLGDFPPAHRWQCGVQVHNELAHI
jgi:hypothetical protein